MGWMAAGHLDDILFLKMPSKLMLALGCCWAQWARFFIERKVYITSYSMYITIHLVICWEEAGMGGWQWIVLDVVAIFGTSKSGWIWLIYSNHDIAPSILTQL